MEVLTEENSEHKAQWSSRAIEDYSIKSLNEALRGDRVKVRQLIDLITPVIQARVARLLLAQGSSAVGGRIREEVSDTTQEVFALLFADGAKVLRKWDPSRGLSIKNYVGLIAHRFVISTLRSKRKSPFTELPTEDTELTCLEDSTPSVEGQVLSRDLLREVFCRTQGALTPNGRRLFELLFLQELEINEVIQKTGMSDSAVYAWKSRLQKLLKAKYEEVAMELESLRKMSVVEVGP